MYLGSDFNNDNMLDFDDLHKTLECLTGDKLEPAERTRVIQKVTMLQSNLLCMIEHR